MTFLELSRVAVKFISLLLLRYRVAICLTCADDDVPNKEFLSGVYWSFIAKPINYCYGCEKELFFYESKIFGFIVYYLESL